MAQPLPRGGGELRAVVVWVPEAPPQRPVLSEETWTVPRVQGRVLPAPIGWMRGRGGGLGDCLMSLLLLPEDRHQGDGAERPVLHPAAAVLETPEDGTRFSL